MANNSFEACKTRIGSRFVLVVFSPIDRTYDYAGFGKYFCKKKAKELNDYMKFRERLER